MNKMSTLRDYSVLNKRLKKLLTKKRLSIKALSNKTGISVGAIQNMTSSPECNPTLEKIEQVAKALTVPISFLIGESSDLVNNEIKVPVITWQNLDNISKIEPKNDELTDNEHYVTSFQAVPEKAFALKMQGKAMTPIFVEGTLLIFDPDKKPYDGSYGLFYIKKTTSYLFRELVIDGANYYYKACNPSFDDSLNKLENDDEIIAILTRAQQDY